nr:hypothetical protein [Tanacetum cinerariifolium]
QVNDFTRLQALVDRKKVVIAEATIRDALRLDDAEGVDLSVQQGNFYRKVFSNMRRVGKGFSGVETPLFEGMLVEQEIEEARDADEHVKEVTTSDDAHGDDSAAHGEVLIVTKEPSIPSPTPPTPPPQPPQDLPSTSQERMMAEMDKDDVVVRIDDKDEDKKVEEAKVDESAQVQERQVES